MEDTPTYRYCGNCRHDGTYGVVLSKYPCHVCTGSNRTEELRTYSRWEPIQVQERPATPAVDSEGGECD